MRVGHLWDASTSSAELTVIPSSTLMAAIAGYTSCYIVH